MIFLSARHVTLLFAIAQQQILKGSVSGKKSCKALKFFCRVSQETSALEITEAGSNYQGLRLQRNMHHIRAARVHCRRFLSTTSCCQLWKKPDKRGLFLKSVRQNCGPFGMCVCNPAGGDVEFVEIAHFLKLPIFC